MANWCSIHRKELINDRGGKCEFCGETKGLEFAHKRKSFLGSGRGCVERVRMVEENPKKFLLLCEECHLEYDRGEI